MTKTMAISNFFFYLLTNFAEHRHKWETLGHVQQIKIEGDLKKKRGVIFLFHSN